MRCRSCGAVNRIPADRLNSGPKCGSCKTPLDVPRAPVEATEATFGAEALRWPGPVLVEFWSPRCGVCRSLAPEIAALARRRPGRPKIVTVNTEQSPSLAQRFAIQAVPTFILYRSGMRINELKGGLPGPQLEQWIEASLRSQGPR